MITFNQVKVKFGILCLIGAMTWACGGNDSTADPEPDPVTKDRQALLTNLADNIIVPAYANFKTKLDVMLAKSQAFSTKPDAGTLAEFRQAWADAYVEWQKVELFDVGPANKVAMRNYFNIYPVSVSGINEYIADPTINLEVTASFDKQGFPALDYLLNGVGTTDAQIVAYYTAPTEGPKRLAYIKRITDHMNALITKVTGDWKDTYRTEFTTKTGLDIGSPMGQLVNGYVLYYERFIRSGKFGIPSGAMLNGVAAAEKVEGFYKKDLSKQLAQAAHQAAVDFFNGKGVTTGKEGPSFKTYLTALGAKDSSTGMSLADIINKQFDAANQKISVLKPNLYEEVKTNNAAMVAVYTEMQKAVRMLKVDMTSAMSIVITYTDNDGD
ncbi:imelysin family protein [Runella sp.]|uniref:imelysin family protein n=1 Tax=Runella sp. TaxID=1960881 RepID=UPI003D107346